MRLIAPDLPGFGHSPADPAGRYSVARLAEAVGSFLADLNPGTVCLVAHSVGAQVGILVADRYPGQVARLVVVDAGPAFGPALQGVENCSSDYGQKWINRLSYPHEAE